MVTPANGTVAVASEYVTVALRLPTSGETAMSCGQVIVGGLLSRTITRKLHVDDSRALLNAVHVTVVVVAIWNWLPEGMLHVRFMIPEPSVALGAGLYITVAYSCPTSGLTMVSVTGHVITGGVVSVQATKKEHEADAPPELNAVQVTLVLVPRINVLPEIGAQVFDVMASTPPAEAVYVAVADGIPVVGLTLKLDGHETVGGVALLTATVKMHFDVLLA